jgi:hypothetical protein
MRGFLHGRNLFCILFFFFPWQVLFLIPREFFSFPQEPDMATDGCGIAKCGSKAIGDSKTMHPLLIGASHFIDTFWLGCCALWLAELLFLFYPVISELNRYTNNII